MNRYFVTGLVVGLAVGSIGIYRVLKSKYEQVAQEEIDSMREYYQKKTSDSQPVETVEDLVEQQEYAGNDIFEPAPHNAIRVSKNPEIPYVISPAEYGEMDGYEKVTLIFYADNVLADEMNEIVDDVEATVGTEALGTFGLYEPDSVHVRNDARQCDYEILLDKARYFEPVKRKARRQGG